MRANYGVAAKTVENITVKKPAGLSTTGFANAAEAGN